MATSKMATYSFSTPANVLYPPVLNRLGNMAHGNICAAIKVGNGAGEFKNSVVGAGREVKSFYCSGKQALFSRAKLAVHFDFGQSHR